MKKKILLILTFIVCTIISVNKVSAIEYTCGKSDYKLITEYAGSQIQPTCCPAKFNYGSRWNGGVQVYGCFASTTDKKECEKIGGKIATYNSEKECFADSENPLEKVTFKNTDKGTQTITCKPTGGACKITAPDIKHTSEKIFLGYSKSQDCSSIDMSAGTFNNSKYNFSTLYACYDKIYVICEYEEDITIYYGENTFKFYDKDNYIQTAQRLRNSVTKEIIDNYYKNKGYCPRVIYKQSGGYITYYGVTDSSGCPGLLDIDCEKFKLTKKNVIVENITPPDDNDPGIIDSCSELIGKETRKLINEVMKWIRISVPILLIGLGILDFTRAAFSKNEDDMKKIREKFIKRIIAAVLVFLVPIFVNLILDLANSVWNNISSATCID